MDGGSEIQTKSGGAAVIFDEEDEGYVESVGGFGGHQLHVLGHGWIVQPKHGAFIVPEDVISAADVDSLRLGMLDNHRCCQQLPGSTEYVNIALETGADFHAHSADTDSVQLWVEADRVFAVTETRTRRVPPWSELELGRLLAPAARGHDCFVSEVYYESRGGDPTNWGYVLPPAEAEALRRTALDDPHEIHVRVQPNGPMTCKQLIAAGRDVAALLDAYQGGSITVASARNLLRGGRASLLIGLPENEWLEIKSRAYALRLAGAPGERQKIELAQDVARFANGDSDAVIVIGLKEARRASMSVVGSVTPVPLSEIDVDQYRAVIDARLVPPIDGLGIERVCVANEEGLLLISIPRQPKEMQPYLVQGAIAGDKVEGSFISVVRRRGEGSITTSAAQIHAYLVAGRAYLKGASVMQDADSAAEVEPPS
ncbi:AlbA family DNA-binding domain-containing protein [Blastococcus deserti]|uniref:Helix-turn-helix domain-containing protein n=1 Tax=Blastococcus deserti TaxID=2259033 RepID=A0ABW4XDA2_9ACTN